MKKAEDKSVEQYFKENFINKTDNKKIVIYGIGEWTERIINAFPSVEIFGLMDGHMTDGSIYGKRVISCNMCIGQNVKIVILARSASVVLIYKRISEFCKGNNIPIYNIEGKRLDVPDSIDTMYEIDIEEIYNALMKYDIISFDIFDTLLIRRSLYRESIYRDIMQKENLKFDFVKYRLDAERKLQQNSEEPNLQRIYEYIEEKAMITHNLIEKLLCLEIELEKKNLIVREYMLKLYNQLKENGKKIYLISDTYFSKEILESILLKEGISEYTEIFASCEYGVNKQNGLYELYNKLIPDTNKVHIGDSLILDGKFAEKSGLKAFVIPSIIDTMIQKNSKELLLNYKGETPEVIRALSFTKLFDTKKIVSNKIYIQSGYQLGYSILAPILYGWAQWIYNMSFRDKVDKVLFVSRDGYLLEKVFNKICTAKGIKVPEAYLQISRTLAWKASVFDDTDLDELKKLPFEGKISDWLKQKFNISSDIDINYKGNEEIIDRHKQEIKDESAKTRTRYLDYLDMYLDNASNIAIVDFVSSGTCQRRLEKISGKKITWFIFQLYSKKV